MRVTDQSVVSKDFVPFLKEFGCPLLDPLPGQNVDELYTFSIPKHLGLLIERCNSEVPSSFIHIKKDVMDNYSVLFSADEKPSLDDVDADNVFGARLPEVLNPDSTFSSIGYIFGESAIFVTDKPHILSVGRLLRGVPQLEQLGWFFDDKQQFVSMLQNAVDLKNGRRNLTKRNDVQVESEVELA